MKRSHNKEGSTLLVVMIFILVVAGVAGAMLVSSGTHYKIASKQHDVERALYIAEGGAERAAEVIEAAGGYLANETTGNGSLGDGTFNYTITKIAWRTYSIMAQGFVNGVGRQVDIARAYLPTYAKYALWMDENGRIYFIPGEEFDGHVHSNDKLWFASYEDIGGPVFWKECTSAEDEYGGTITWVEFHEGFEMEADQGQMSDINFDDGGSTSLRSLAQSFGTVLEGRTYVEFDGDKMLVTNSRQGWTDHELTIQPDDIIYVEDSNWGSSSTRSGKIYVEGGTVDGRMSLVSENDIIIRDHIRYSDNPIDNPDSDDALGLIAQDDVWVDTSAPDDLDIFAAMIAAGTSSAYNDGSFGVIDYDEDSPRGFLNVHGSIVQDVRGAVGQFSTSSGLPVHGYSKNYTFDERFETAAPPYYPVIDEEIVYEGWSDGPA